MPSPLPPRFHLSLGCLALICALGSTADAGAPTRKVTPLRKRAATARARIEADQQRYGSSDYEPSPQSLRHTGRTMRIFRAIQRGAGSPVIVRLPRYGTANGVRRHKFVRMLGIQLGYPSVVPPAAEVKLAAPIGSGTIKLGEFERSVKRGDSVMVVEDVGDKFQVYDELWGRPDVEAALPEDFRVSGALMHLLSWQIDGNPSNFLMRIPPKRQPSVKDVRLIDHDVTLGIRHSGPILHGSIFAPGKPLAYSGRQATVDDLPPKARQLVKDIASSTIEEIADVYGVEPIEATWIRGSARLIRKVGLTEAFHRFYTDGQKYRDPTFHQRGDTLLPAVPFNPPYRPARAKPAEPARRVETSIPAEPARHLETSTPAEPARRTETSTHAESTRHAEPASRSETPPHAELTKPAGSARPAESAKPAEPAKRRSVLRRLLGPLLR